MISFESDYIAGAHPKIIKRISDINYEASSGYGSDVYTKSAMEKIRAACQCPQAQIYFTVGGTQTNQLVISTVLKDYEGVVAAHSGHINTHEAGAIEYSGHKVLNIPGHMGKIDGKELRSYLENFFSDDNYEHMVFPGMVYISHPTEYGSLYTKAELTEISNICHQYEIPLYIDGARLAYGLMSNETDLTLPDIAKLADVFYIGGTKVGALFGEAIVFTKENMPKHFITLAKQRGALLAKGKLLGIQFDTFFTDDFYYECGKYAINMKDEMVKILKEAGCEFFYETPTNQQFIIFENKALKKLQEQVAVSYWEPFDEDHTVVRFATSWSTTKEDLEKLREVLKNHI